MCALGAAVCFALERRALHNDTARGGAHPPSFRVRCEARAEVLGECGRGIVAYKQTGSRHTTQSHCHLPSQSRMTHSRGRKCMINESAHWAARTDTNYRGSQLRTEAGGALWTNSEQ